VGAPLLLGKETALLVGGSSLLPLIDVSQVTSDFINGEDVKIKQRLDRNRDLLERLRVHMEHVLHDLWFSDLPTENRDVVGEPSQAHQEIIDRFPVLEPEVVKLFL
jgi:hypothetical protein